MKKTRAITIPSARGSRRLPRHLAGGFQVILGNILEREPGLDCSAEKHCPARCRAALSGRAEDSMQVFKEQRAVQRTFVSITAQTFYIKKKKLQ